MMRDHRQAITYFERAAATSDAEYYAAGMLPGCYAQVGDVERSLVSARRALARCEKAVAVEPDNGSAISFLVTALAMLGERERVNEWIERALLLDPDNLNLRYNLACTLIKTLHDHEAGVELLRHNLERVRADSINWMSTDTDLDPVRDDPRFQAMFSAAQARVARDLPLA